MPKKEVKVTFRTITPLWTGDAWQENREIRPSSLIGSLRFWFSVYWKIVRNGFTEKLDKDGVPKENLSELENPPKENKIFKEILREKIREVDSFDKAIDETLNELGLSVPSRVFGCTGWKSRIKITIENYNEEEIRFNDLDFDFPNRINTKFWIKKILFQEKDSIKVFKDISVKLITDEYWWDNYLKDFFEFFQDKLILVGGKNSFGFGFVNLQLSGNNPYEFQPIKGILEIRKIENINYSNGKKVLGFNFKYFLQKQENKKFRKLNFGKQGKTSKVYVSNLLQDEKSKYILYLILLNNPFDYERAIPPQVLSKYFNKLKYKNNV